MDDLGAPAREAADAVARRSYGKLVAFLAARTGDVAGAEDALAEAFAAALADWPGKGCPDNPEAWLLTVARRKSLDAHRRRRTGEAGAAQVLLLAEEAAAPGVSELPDHRLALMFACAHPAVDVEMHAPLILQVVLGLDAKAIGSAFLISPAAMGKRLVRAKQRLRQTGAAFAMPGREDLPARLQAVLDAIYAAFTEGWSSPDGADAVRRGLAQEAIFLARLTAELAPRDPEALGLAALLLYAESRRGARRGPDGDYVPLAEQDIALWDQPMIAEAETLLRRAAGLGVIGRYQLEAALQSAHVERRRTGRENWNAVVQIYDALVGLSGSPVAQINRALAIAERGGAAAGLEAMPSPSADARLADYQPYWAARAPLLAATGAHAESHHAYQIAIGLERDPDVRRFLQRRQAAVASP